jgi:hypothetical protein
MIEFLTHPVPYWSALGATFVAAALGQWFGWWWRGRSERKGQPEPAPPAKKPRLFRHEGDWYYSGFGFMGRGETPAEAYKGWLRSTTGLRNCFR